MGSKHGRGEAAPEGWGEPLSVGSRCLFFPSVDARARTRRTQCRPAYSWIGHPAGLQGSRTAKPESADYLGSIWGSRIWCHCLYRPVRAWILEPSFSGHVRAST